MIDKLKDYLIQVAAKRMVPSAVRAIIAALVGLVLAHAEILSHLGIVYDPATRIISVHLDALTAWLIAGGLGLCTALLTMLQHHGEQLIAPPKSTPEGKV